MKMDKNTSKSTLVFAFLLLLLSVALGCGIDPSQLLPEQTVARLSPSIETRTISQDFSRNIIWRRNDISIRLIPILPPVLLAGHGYIAYVNFIGGPLDAINQLDVLDANSGTTLWQSRPFPDHEAIALSKGRAYVLLDLGRTLNVYDIGDNSEPLYSYNYFKEFTQFYMFPTVVREADNIYIYYEEGNEYFLHSIDLEGKAVAGSRKVQVTGRHPRLTLLNAPFFLTEGEGEFIAADLETGKELWHIPRSDQINSWPVLRYETLIIPVGTSLRNKIIAVDTKTGERLWETEKEFVSNVVLYNDNLYALRNDATLVKFAFTTGQIEQEIPFEPALTSGGERAYLLASDEERLFVYFGDSQELFALKTP